MASKTTQKAQTGPWCCRCHKPIRGIAVPRGFEDLCETCFLRPRIIVQIMEDLQRRERQVAS